MSEETESIDWKSRAERAEKACAEMREALDNLVDQQNGPPLLTYKEAWQQAMDKAEHALSTSCGSGYVRREELEAVKYELCREQEKPKLADEKQVRENIAYLVSLTNKQQAELDAAKAESAEARSNVEKCLRELSGIVKERDAAKAENARLREALRYTAYQRLPLGDTVIEHLPEHWQQAVKHALAGKKG